MASVANRTALALAGSALLLIGIIVGYLLPSGLLATGHDFRSRASYQYVSPLLECAEMHNLSPGEIRQLRGDIERLIADEKGRGNASEVAVYFRDLNNGPWFGINDEATFTPGSLTKVPLMMSIFNKAEREPHLLDQSVTYAESMGYATPKIVSSSSLAVGQQYPLSEIVRVMIVNSDNAAAEVAYRTLGAEALNETFTDLGLAPLPIDRDYAITVRHYASFFRILFNATYLSPESSERALTLLTESEFKDGLVAGVPTDVPVAHKFGEREVGAIAQLHDCGIVYVPQRPYTLCIMTRGGDASALIGIIKKISRLSYEAMSS